MCVLRYQSATVSFLCHFISTHIERNCVCLQRRLCANSSVIFVNQDHHHELHDLYRIFKSNCRVITLCWPMQHVKRLALMHRILTAAVPWNYVCLLHDKCRLSRKSLISVLELKSLVLVLEPWVLVNIPENIAEEKMTFARFHLVTRYSNLTNYEEYWHCAGTCNLRGSHAAFTIVIWSLTACMVQSDRWDQNQIKKCVWWLWTFLFRLLFYCVSF